MKKISVIIPCYNVIRWIDRCLTSIFRQTIGMDVLEVICIDDASTDDSWKYLQKWEQRFPENIILVRLNVNRRLGAARNIGLQYASADWIAFVDADDWLEEDYFELLYQPVTENICDIVCCGSMRDSSETLTYFNRNVRSIQGKEDQLIISDTELMKKMMLRNRSMVTGAWAMLIRRSMLVDNAVFFPEDLVYEDRYWAPMLYIYANSIYFLEKCLYHYFSNTCSITFSENKDHLVDWMTVQLMKWKEYENRGFLIKYRVELEHDSLYDAVKIMSAICRHENPSFSLYQLEKQIITERIPDYREDPYFEDFQETARCMLEALYSPLDKEGFRQFQQTIKQMKELLKGLESR